MLFRKASRDAILTALESILPTSLPVLHLASPPAHELRLFIDRSIVKFQNRVSAKVAAHAAETRWFYQRALDNLRSPPALRSWLYGLLPDTVSEIWTVVLLSLVGVFAMSCINTFAQLCQDEEREAEAAAAAVAGKAGQGAGAAPSTLQQRQRQGSKGKAQ